MGSKSFEAFVSSKYVKKISQRKNVCLVDGPTVIYFLRKIKLDSKSSSTFKLLATIPVFAVALPVYLPLFYFRPSL